VDQQQFLLLSLPRSSGGFAAAGIKKKAILLHSFDNIFTKPCFTWSDGKNTFTAPVEEL
jgi:hypothetical protein